MRQNKLSGGRFPAAARAISGERVKAILLRFFSSKHLGDSTTKLTPTVDLTCRPLFHGEEKENKGGSEGDLGGIRKEGTGGG